MISPKKKLEMKLTEPQLTNIIQEEFNIMINEGRGSLLKRLGQWLGVTPTPSRVSDLSKLPSTPGPDPEDFLRSFNVDAPSKPRMSSELEQELQIANKMAEKRFNPFTGERLTPDLWAKLRNIETKRSFADLYGAEAANKIDYYNPFTGAEFSVKELRNQAEALGFKQLP